MTALSVIVAEEFADWCRPSWLAATRAPTNALEVSAASATITGAAAGGTARPFASCCAAVIAVITRYGVQGVGSGSFRLGLVVLASARRATTMLTRGAGPVEAKSGAIMPSRVASALALRDAANRVREGFSFLASLFAKFGNFYRSVECQCVAFEEQSFSELRASYSGNELFAQVIIHGSGEITRGCQFPERQSKFGNRLTGKLSTFTKMMTFHSDVDGGGEVVCQCVDGNVVWVRRACGSGVRGRLFFRRLADRGFS